MLYHHVVSKHLNGIFLILFFLFLQIIDTFFQLAHFYKYLLVLKKLSVTYKFFLMRIDLLKTQ